MSTIASSLREIKATLAQLLASTQTVSLDSLDQLRKKDPDRADGLLAAHIGGIEADRQKKIFEMAESLRVRRREKAMQEKEEEEKKKKETERKVEKKKKETTSNNEPKPNPPKPKPPTHQPAPSPPLPPPLSPISTSRPRFST